MRKELFYDITEDGEGKTVASYLAGYGYSHNLIDNIKHLPAGLSVDGETVFAKRPLLAGETLRVTLPAEKSDIWIVPEEMPLAIVYEDEDLLVVNKEAGILVHPTQAHPDGTLANGLRWYFDQKGEPFTFRVVNRLDRDTSGLLIVPRHALSAGILGGALARREIRRVYLTAATGDMRDVFPSGEGTIDAPIAVVPGQSLLREVNLKEGEEARTEVKILCYNADRNVTLCEVTLETGRTHQIRVHFQSIGHPLPGDFLYNPEYHLIGRQALHAARLSFAHPITGEALSFSAPLPKDMQVFLQDSETG